MTSAEKITTRRRCKNIRDRLYPREESLGAVFRREVLCLASDDATIVDIGCGRRASFVRDMSKWFGVAYGVDLEIPEKVIEGNITLLPGNANDIPLADSSVDVVTMVNVLEHVECPQRVFTECRRILKPGGSFVLITPNKLFPVIAAGRMFPHRVKQLVNRFVTGGSPEDTFPAYYRANSVGGLRRIATSAGLLPNRVEYWSSHPEYFMFSVLIYRSAAFLERWLLQRRCLAWARHFIFAHLVKCAE